MTSYNSTNDFVVPIQFISINAQGYIKKSDQNLLRFEEETPLKEAHPFFESVLSLFDSKAEHIKLDCVNMFETYFDIEVITRKDNTGVIILRDRTRFYNRIQEAAKKPNESNIFNEVLNLKNELLQEKEVFKNKFIKNFSYEVKGPLTLINSFSSLLLKGELDLEQTKLVEAVKDQSDTLRKLMDAIIELSQLKREKPELANVTFSFKDLLNHIHFSFNTKINISNNTFEMLISKEVPEFLIGDKGRIEQMIKNLIENALLYNKGNHIKLEITENSRRAGKSSLRFVVHHEGRVPDYLEDNYVLRDLEKIEPEGLYFSIIRELVGALNGTISIRNIDDNITQQIINLKISFPLHHIQLKTKQSEYIEKYNFTEKVKVLVADENNTAQLTTLKILISSNNFDTTVYDDPRELLEAVEKHEYDLILMSSSISQVDSIELIGIIKQFANKNNKNIPVIALTVHTSKEDLATYLRAGFKDIIKKPYTDDELLNSIYKMLDLKKFLW
jgi:signal transduction histidine kinase/CheY-like chemotaxis protein